MTKPTYNFAVDGIHGRRRFRLLGDAERFARRQCGMDGELCTITSLMDGSNGQYVAQVRRDYLHRVWTDVAQMQGSFL